MSIRVSASTDAIRRTTNLPSSTAFTMAAWVKVNARTGNSDEIFLYLRQSAGNALGILWDTTLGAGAKFAYSWVGHTFNFVTEIPNGTWEYCAITSAGTAIGDVDAYYGVDPTALAASARTSSTTQSSITPAGMSAMCHPTNSSEQVDGWIAHCRVWDAALTITELQAEMVSSTIVRTANINTAFSGTAGSANDISGNGRNWTVTGTSADADDPLAVAAAAPTLYTVRSAVRLGS